MGGRFEFSMIIVLVCSYFSLPAWAEPADSSASPSQSEQSSSSRSGNLSDHAIGSGQLEIQKDCDHNSQTARAAATVLSRFIGASTVSSGPQQCTSSSDLDHATEKEMHQ